MCALYMGGGAQSVRPSLQQRSLIKLLACLLIVVTTLITACERKKKEPAAPESTLPAAATTSTQPPPVVPAPAVTQTSWAPDALEELVAPIALYPDQLLTQILAASVNSQEVLDGGNWLLENQTLKGDDLDTAAQKVGFGAPMRALLQFPTVVDMMCQQIDWTRQLGAAFTSDQKGVLDAVQRLRAQAEEVGNLKSTPQQTVTTKTENEKTIVEVKSADPKVVYVPQYNPEVIYTTAPPAQPAPTPTPTPTNTEDTVSTETAVAAGLLAFGAGVLIGNAFSHDDYCYPNWGYSTVYMGARPFYPPAYAYRPAYGPTFHPAYRYAPPAGYRNSYNSYNRNNVFVNNNNYYNRFSNNQNLRSGTVRSPLAASRQTTAQNRNENWRGQSTYVGTRNTASTERNVARTERNAANAERNVPNAQRNVTNTQRNTTNAQRNAETARANRDAQQKSAERAVTKPAEPPNNELNTQANARTTERSTIEDRGYSDSNRFDSAPRAAADTPQRSRENALAGADAQGNGAFERAASARGQASSGGRRFEGGGREGGGRRR